MDVNNTWASVCLWFLENGALDLLAAVRTTAWGKIVCAALLWAFAVSTANHWTGLGEDAVAAAALPSVLTIGGVLAWALRRRRSLVS